MRPGLNMHETRSRESVCGGQCPQEQRGGLSSKVGQGCGQGNNRKVGTCLQKIFFAFISQKLGAEGGGKRGVQAEASSPSPAWLLNGVWSTSITLPNAREPCSAGSSGSSSNLHVNTLSNEHRAGSSAGA